MQLFSHFPVLGGWNFGWIPQVEIHQEVEFIIDPKKKSMNQSVHFPFGKAPRKTYSLAWYLWLYGFSLLSRETSRRYDCKLRQIPFFEVGGGFTQKKADLRCVNVSEGPKKSWSLQTSLISGDQMEANETFWTSDSERHRYAQTCLSLPVLWYTLERKNSKLWTFNLPPKPEKKRRSYPQDGPRVYHSRPNIGGWFIIRLLKVKNVGPTINIRCIGWNKLPACRSDSPRNMFLKNKYLCVQISKLQHLHAPTDTNFTNGYKCAKLSYTTNDASISTKGKKTPHPKPSVWSNVYIARRLRRKPF